MRVSVICPNCRYRNLIIPVGTPVTRRPPDRSQRAGLPHWAPALGKNAQALIRIRMSDFRNRKPTFFKAAHPIPIQARFLTSPA